MRLEWLNDILAVAETGSLSEAAERRNLTQSAFSRRVRVIEDYVGAPLFDRGRKPLQMQPTTARQRDQIAKLAEEIQQLVSDLRMGSEASQNRVIFASQHALTTSLTPDLLHWLNGQFPDVYVRLRSANQDECFGLLLSRQADLAFVYRAEGDEHLIEAEFIETVTLGRDRLIPVFAHHLSDALNEEFQSGQLPFIAYPRDVFLGQTLEKSILPPLRQIIHPIPKAETALTLAATELAMVGIGVAWIPSSLAFRKIKENQLIDLSSTLPSINMDVTAVRVAGSSNSANAMLWSHLLSISHSEASAWPYLDGLNGANK